jgi:hypothetical protein
MMHGQIHFGLYTTLINLNPAAYKERAKQKKRGREKRERGSQAIITTPLRCRQEGYEQLTEEPSMTGILKPDGLRSRGLPSHPSSGRRCTRTPGNSNSNSISGKCDRTAVTAN